MNIVLIGMPGCGKSTIGVLLAKTLLCEFVDTDLIIQNKYKKSLCEIISEEGLEAFKEKENKVLSEINCENSVIATGGSAVYCKEGMENLMKNGRVVYLKLSPEEIKKRIKNIKTRGIAMKEGTTIEQLHLEEPEIVRQGGKYGVKLRASAPSVHMMRADITTEVAPIVGSEKQSEDLVRYLLDEFEEDPAKIWESNIFGKSLHELVNEGLHTKLSRMPQEARLKIQETISRIINEGCSGLVCLIL